MNILILVLLVASTTQPAPPDNLLPLNLDFQRPGVVHPDMPWSWSMQPLIRAGVHVERSVDPVGLRLGRSEDGKVAIADYYFNDAFEGRRLEIEATVSRPEDSAASVRLGLWELNRDRDYIESWSPPTVDGVATVMLEMSPKSWNALARLEYTGRGEIVVSPIRLKIDGELIQQTTLPGQSDPVDVDVEFVRRHALPLATTALRAPLDDLATLRPMIADAAIVMLGESTHGTSEFFTLRNRMMRWLMEQEGFTIIAVEDHAVPVAAIDHYIRTGEGDPQALVRRLFGVWGRQETLEFIQWMRVATMAGTIRATLVGVDLQVPIGSLELLDAFAARHDPALARDIDAALGPMQQAWNEGWYPQRSSEEHQRWIGGATHIMKLVDDRALRYGDTLSEEQIEHIKYHARLIWQSATNSVATSMRLRDRYMAENLTWIREHLPPGTRIALWAHNTHIRLDEDAMGQHLEARYPGEVMSVGFFTQRGDYAAYSGTSYQKYSLFPGPPESIEYLLHLSGHEILAIDLRGHAAQTSARLLHQEMLHRNIGLWPADLGFYPAPIAKGFHAIAFVDRTTATRPLPSPR